MKVILSKVIAFYVLCLSVATAFSGMTVMLVQAQNRMASRASSTPSLELKIQPSKLTDSSSATQALRPNEVGKVLILEYHLIQPEETRWGRSLENFKKDLERLYQDGYRPISMAEYIDGKIDLSAGTKPVILTFDDSSPGQLRYLLTNGKPEIDPQCAVAMLLDFNQKHPDFRNKAIFFVLPEAKQPHKLFGQPEFESEKLRQLAALGFEIGNHTLWHANLGKYDATTVQKQLAESVAAIQKMVSGYKVRVLALPFGVYPKDLNLAVTGSYKGISYHNEAILEVAGGAAPSPFSSACNLTHLPRIQVPSSDFQYWLKYFDKHPDEVFVSDGKVDTISLPLASKSRFNSAKFKSLKLDAY
ncbi:MAG: polysaccharide deacetylase [Acidobacteria bacterium]|nr:MAG: polysaccharide deacetylase [Acidobacteriota bacterium]